MVIFNILYKLNNFYQQKKWVHVTTVLGMMKKIHFLIKQGTDMINVR